MPQGINLPECNFWPVAITCTKHRRCNKLMNRHKKVGEVLHYGNFERITCSLFVQAKKRKISQRHEITSLRWQEMVSRNALPVLHHNLWPVYTTCGLCALRCKAGNGRHGCVGILLLHETKIHCGQFTAWCAKLCTISVKFPTNKIGNQFVDGHPASYKLSEANQKQIFPS